MDRASLARCARFDGLRPGGSRAFEAAAQVDDNDPLVPGDEVAIGEATLRDHEAFGRDFDPLRADRLRIAPMRAFHPTESSRFRIQYGFDDSEHLTDTVHSVWIGFEVMLGSHEHQH